MLIVCLPFEAIQVSEGPSDTIHNSEVEEITAMSDHE